MTGVTFSTEFKELAAKLLEIQKIIEAPARSGFNTQYKKHYTTMPDLADVVKDKLNDAGILISQGVEHIGPDDGRQATTLLFDTTNGQWLKNCYSNRHAADGNLLSNSAAAGSNAMKQGLSALLFVIEEEHDAGTKRKPTPRAGAQRPPAKAPAKQGRAPVFNWKEAEERLVEHWDKFPNGEKAAAAYGGGDKVEALHQILSGFYPDDADYKNTLAAITKGSRIDGLRDINKLRTANDKRKSIAWSNFLQKTDAVIAKKGKQK